MQTIINIIINKYFKLNNKPHKKNSSLILINYLKPDKPKDNKIKMKILKLTYDNLNLTQFPVNMVI